MIAPKRKYHHHDYAHEQSRGLSSALRKTIAPKAQRKHVASRLFAAMISGGGAYTQSRWDKRLISEQAYERNLPFFFAVNLVAQTVASLPIVVRCGTHGKRKTTTEHPLLRALAMNQDLYDFVERMTLNYVTFGENHALIVTSDINKKPLGVVVMPEVNVKNVEGTWRKPIAAYDYADKGRIERFDEADVIHTLKPSLSNYFEPMPVAIPSQELIALNNAGITWNKNIAQGGGMPSVLAKISGGTEEEAKEYKAMWREQRGAQHAGDLTVVPDRLEFEQFNIPPTDAEWEKAVLLSLRFILMGLGVSSSMANDAGNKTYNNVKDARKGLYTEGAIPIGKRILSAINRKMSVYYDDNPVLELDIDNIEAIQEEKAKQWDRLVKAVNAGIITANEARAEMKKPPAKGPTADLLQNSSTINNIPKVDGEADPQPPGEDDGQED